MRIDLLQLAPDYSLEIAQRRAAVRSATLARRGADLVVLPELWPQGGFLYEQWDELAEPLDGPTVALVCEAAAALGAFVHGGSFIERSATGELFNTSVLAGPDGSVVTVYRKIHLFGFAEGEPKWLSAGREVVVAHTVLGPVGLATCYDLRFPEMFRQLVDAGAEMVVVPAAWPAARIGHWSLLAQARAVEDQLVVVAANTAGSQAGKVMGGRSLVVDARGAVLAEAGPDAAVLTAEVDLGEVTAWRRRFPVLDDRRL